MLADDPPRPPHQSAISLTRLREGYGAGVHLGYQAFYGRPSSWEGIGERLREYALGQVLEVLGRVSAVLESEDESAISKQVRLIDALFGAEGGPILARLAAEHERAQADPGRAGAIAIDETSVLTVLKAACWNLPPGGDGSVARPLRALGEALLIANDLADRAPIAPTDAALDQRDGLQQWAYYVTVNALFRHRERQMHWICRAYELYLTDRRHLRERSADYLDLPTLMQAATGLAPEQLWAVLFAFLSPFAQIRPSTVASDRALIPRHRFFGDNYAFTSEETERFWSFMARDVESFSAEMRQRYSPSAIHPFSALPLSRSPLVVDGGLAFAPYLPELYAKLTTGLHYLVLDSLPAARRGQFLRYIGEVFEDYIAQLFRRVYGDTAAKSGATGAARYIDGQTLRAALAPKRGPQPKVCDGLIVEGDMVILLETKAKLLTADARNGHDAPAFFAKFEEIVVRGARQLDATATHLRAGRLRSLGLDPKRVRMICPVLISLQSLPYLVVIPSERGAPLYAWTALRLQEEGLLRQPGVQPLQFMEASECEELEARLLRGDSLQAILEAKLSDPVALRESFQNFFFLRRPLPGKPTNRYLEARYEQLTAAALAFFRARRPGTAADTDASTVG
ncbi:MAG TPA: hypothetical protein VFS33_05775 [Gemmatimonadales bacterium]|nr:hypothetical protein [Gemmatimonadales bacterium]